MYTSCCEVVLHGDTSSLIDSNPSALLHCLLRIDVVWVEDVPPQAASMNLNLCPRKMNMVPWSTLFKARCCDMIWQLKSSRSSSIFIDLLPSSAIISIPSVNYHGP